MADNDELLKSIETLKQSIDSQKLSIEMQQQSIAAQTEQVNGLIGAIANMSSVMGEMLEDLAQQNEEQQDDSITYMDGTPR